jgi:hypothetical protein
MAYHTDNDLKILAVFAWFLAVPVLLFVLYLIWRQFRPGRRHRRHRGRSRRYLGH